MYQGCQGSSLNEFAFTVIAENSTIENFVLTDMQSAKTPFQCFGTAKQQQDVLNTISNLLAAEVNAATGGGITPALFNATYGIDVATATQNVTNKITNDAMVKSIQSCIDACANKANVSFVLDNSTIINTSFSITQNNENFVNCVFQTSNVQMMTNDITNQLQAKSSASAGGFNALLGVLIIIVVLGCATAGIYYLWSRNKQQQEQQQQKQETTQPKNSTPA